MSDEELGYSDYLKEAVNLRAPLPGLGGLPVNWLVLLGIAMGGLWNPGIWLVGMALEVLFLASVTHNERFRNYVRGKRLVEANQAASQTFQERAEALYGQLDAVGQQRHDALVERCGRVRAADTDVTELIGGVAEEGLQDLQWIYLRLLVSREVLVRQVDQHLRDELEAELEGNVRRLEQLGTTGDERVRRSLESTIDILRRRIDNLESAASDVTYIDSELRRIEHQAELIIEEATLTKDPDALTSRIDAVTRTFGETREWMRLHQEVLGDLGDDDEPRARPPRVLA